MNLDTSTPAASCLDWRRELGKENKMLPRCEVSVVILPVIGTLRRAEGSVRVFKRGRKNQSLEKFKDFVLSVGLIP